MGSKSLLQEGVEAWQERRNQVCAGVDWRFATRAARIQLKRLYPSINP